MNKCKEAPKYTEEQVFQTIEQSTEFANHVKNVTRNYIETLNLPTEGILSGFNFNTEKRIFTVNHEFVYEGEQKQCFYVIPMHLLWTTLTVN